MKRVGRPKDTAASPPRDAPGRLAKATPYVSEQDFADWAYAPHTVSVGFGLVFGVLYAASYLCEGSEQANIKFGIGAAAWTFVVFGALHLPDGLMIRPHPFVWRGLTALAILYLLFVVFMLWQDLPTVRKIWGFYDPQLLNTLPEQSYATDCRISTPEEPYKFFTTVFDEFVLAHALGYWAKTLELRDWRIVTCVSVGFELIEVSFQHVLPNFAECWWDHVLADVLICNAGGTVLGMLTLRWVNAKTYSWTRLGDIPTRIGKAKRVLGQLAPRRGLDAYQWHMFQSPKRFLQVLLVLAVMFAQEVNCFTMKYILNMAPSYHFVVGRLAFFGFVAVSSLREFYDFISEPSQKRLGTTAWVGAACIIAESLWIGKMARQGEYFRQPMPAHIALPWCYCIVAFGTWAVLYFGHRTAWGQRSTPAAAPKGVFGVTLTLLWWSMPLVLLAMCAMGNNDLQWYREDFDAWAARTGYWA